jgi:hypothetical protein
MGESREGKDLLRKVPIRQLVPVSYGDYAVMLGWGLDRYWQALDEKD